jgi:DNA-binding NtrC family response regulator
VRELENVLERAVILAAGEPIGPQHIQLPEPVLVRAGAKGQELGPHASPGPGARGETLFDVERRMLEEALRKAGGNKSKTAKLLGITRRMLYTKLEKFGMAVEGESVDEA